MAYAVLAKFLRLEVAALLKKKMDYWLVLWNMTFMTFHTLGMSSSQLTKSIIFQRGRSTTNQDLMDPYMDFYGDFYGISSGISSRKDGWHFSTEKLIDDSG